SHPHRACCCLRCSHPDAGDRRPHLGRWRASLADGSRESHRAFDDGRRVLDQSPCGPWLLLGSLAAAQVLLHEALMAFAGHGPSDLTSAGVGAHHRMHALLSGPMSAHSASSMDSGMGGVPMPGAGGWSVAMTAAHVVATVVTALLLARGEQALWQLVSRLLPTLPCIPRLPSCGPRQAPVLLSALALRPSLVSSGSGLRGPPVGV